MNTNKLKAVRVEYGYTQEQLAKAIGISAKSYNRKELGLIEFNRREISVIAKTLKLSISCVNDIFFSNEITNCTN